MKLRSDVEIMKPRKFTEPDFDIAPSGPVRVPNYFVRNADPFSGRSYSRRVDMTTRIITSDLLYMYQNVSSKNYSFESIVIPYILTPKQSN